MKISKFVKVAATAAVLATLAAGASASSFSLGTILPGVPKSLVAFGGGNALGSFEDTFSFTLGTGTASSGYSAEAFDFDFFGSSFRTNLTAIKLYNTMGTASTLDDVLVGQTSSVAGSKLLSFGNVATGSGNYYLTVAGKVDTAAGGNAYFYTGSISSSTVSPVPEPETYAMLLAGLGLMGAIARRRNKA